MIEIIKPLCNQLGCNQDATKMELRWINIHQSTLIVNQNNNSNSIIITIIITIFNGDDIDC